MSSFDTKAGFPLGSFENPYTFETLNDDAKLKFCLCGECGKVWQCTPREDCFKVEERGILVCESCLDKSLIRMGLDKIIEVGPPPDDSN